MNEIFDIASMIAKEYNIPTDTVFNALSESIKMSIERKYGEDKNMKIYIDTDNGIFDVTIKKNIVEKPNNEYEISLEDARKIDPEAKIGNTIENKIDTKSLGRIAASITKTTISKLLSATEKHTSYEEYRHYINQVISGEIWSIGVYGDVILDLRNARGILPKREQDSQSKYVVGEILKAYVLDVLEEPRGVKLILSRTHPGFVKELFKKEVPEVKNGSVEIKAVAREPSKRTKVAVYSNDSKIDPIGTCVGSKGVRIANIVRELGDEKVDVIKWSSNLSVYVKNAIAPAKASFVDIDENNRKAKVYVNDDEFSMAIGKNGINVKLVAKLTDYNIDIVKMSEKSNDIIFENIE